MNNQIAQVTISTTYGSPWGTGTNNLGTLIGLILNIAGVLAGVIVITLLLLGGIKIISGANNNDPRSTSDGKQAITWAIIGFVIVFGAYWIIRAIELIIGVDIITNPISVYL